jgi:uncharacterized membrane protein
MTLFNIILVLHIIAGFVGLLLGTFILIRKKGDTIHKLLGKIFAIAMISTGILAFLFFSIYCRIFYNIFSSYGL